MKNFISVSAILDRVMQHPLMHEMPLETGVRYAVDCIRLVGSPVLFDYKYKEVAIEDYRGILPDDFMEMDMESAVRMVSGNAANKEYRAMVSSASIYTEFSNHIEPNKSKEYSANSNILKYTIRGPYIYTPFESGVVDIVYKGLYLDDDSLPYIPDNANLIKAIEFYIKYNHFRILADLGKIHENTAAKAEQEYTWYVGTAQTANVLLTMDDRQAISNMLTNIFINNRDHSTAFENLGLPEKLRRNI